jgi:hypothetical protein
MKFVVVHFVVVLLFEIVNVKARPHLPTLSACVEQVIPAMMVEI